MPLPDPTLHRLREIRISVQFVELGREATVLPPVSLALFIYRTLTSHFINTACQTNTMGDAHMHTHTVVWLVYWEHTARSHTWAGGLNQEQCV